MRERISKRPWLTLAIGVLLGLLVGGGMFVGSFMATHHRASSPDFSEALLHATSTHGADTIAMATGPIDEGMDGLFILDYLTGQLQCHVLNPRTGAVGATFGRNVVADLGSEGKQTKYLLVTGQASFQHMGGNMRLASCVVYVMDSNNGRFAAYSIPWNRAAASYNMTQMNPMILLGTGDARQIALER